MATMMLTLEDLADKINKLQDDYVLLRETIISLDKAMEDLPDAIEGYAIDKLEGEYEALRSSGGTSSDDQNGTQGSCCFNQYIGYMACAIKEICDYYNEHKENMGLS